MHQPTTTPIDAPIALSDAPTPPASLRERLRALASRRALAHRRGMTLIEIMIVVAIMAAIMSVVGYYVFGFSQEANVNLAKTQLGTFKGSMEAYRSMKGRMPRELSDLVESNMMEEIPLDPWGSEYQYQPSGNLAGKIFSAGPDGNPNTEDDIVLEIKGLN